MFIKVTLIENNNEVYISLDDISYYYKNTDDEKSFTYLALKSNGVIFKVKEDLTELFNSDIEEERNPSIPLWI